MIRTLIALVLTAVFAVGAGAQDFGTGRLPLRYSASNALAIASNEQIVIRGQIHAPHAVTLVLRIDDGQSTGYASRVNLERTLPPGSFAWALPAAGIRTSGGRLLASHDIRRLFLFADENATVEISKFAVEPAARLPDGVVALSLGAAEAPLFPGFERVTPNHPWIEAGRPVPVQRPGLDPLITSGLRGVERIRVPWPQKRARLSLWTEDVGEWETLPAALERRIRVNGVDILTQRLTPEQWIAQRYLAGRDREAGPFEDAWDVYGRHRGGLVSTDIEVPDGNIVIELAGDSAVSTFLSAVLIEPGGQHANLDTVQQARAAWSRRGRSRPAAMIHRLSSQGRRSGWRKALRCQRNPSRSPPAPERKSISRFVRRVGASLKSRLRLPRWAVTRSI